MNNLLLQGIDKRFADTLACKDITLHIQEGEFFTFLGPSGCGKTTLLRIIAGFTRPDAGSLFLGSKEITNLPPEQRHIGMVFQNYALFPFMSVRENIEYGLRIQKKSAQEISQKTAYYLEMVGLQGFEKRAIAELSGGEQQRIALARSLATEPKVLLLDEPLSNLDARLRDTMRDELKHLQRRLGITTIFVTHDQKEALSLSDHIAVFQAGSCLQTGTPEKIYMHPTSTFVAQFIGMANIFSLHKQGSEICLPDATPVLQIPATPSYQFVSIRPHCIQLSHSSLNYDYTFHGTISEKQFSGLTTEFTIQTEKMHFSVIHLQQEATDEQFSLGDQVYLGFSASNLLFLTH